MLYFCFFCLFSFCCIFQIGVTSFGKGCARPNHVSLGRLSDVLMSFILCIIFFHCLEEKKRYRNKKEKKREKSVSYVYLLIVGLVSTLLFFFFFFFFSVWYWCGGKCIICTCMCMLQPGAYTRVSHYVPWIQANIDSFGHRWPNRGDTARPHVAVLFATAILSSALMWFNSSFSQWHCMISINIAGCLMSNGVFFFIQKTEKKEKKKN